MLKTKLTWHRTATGWLVRRQTFWPDARVFRGDAVHDDRGHVTARVEWPDAKLPVAGWWEFFEGYHWDRALGGSPWHQEKMVLGMSRRSYAQTLRRLGKQGRRHLELRAGKQGDCGGADLFQAGLMGMAKAARHLRTFVVEDSLPANYTGPMFVYPDGSEEPAGLVDETDQLRMYLSRTSANAIYDEGTTESEPTMDMTDDPFDAEEGSTTAAFNAVNVVMEQPAEDVIAAEMWEVIEGVCKNEQELKAVSLLLRGDLSQEEVGQLCDRSRDQVYRLTKRVEDRLEVYYGGRPWEAETWGEWRERKGLTVPDPEPEPVRQRKFGKRKSRRS